MITGAIHALGASAMLLATTYGLALADWPSDPNSNVALCTAVNAQIRPVIISDGMHGAIVAWEDSRSDTTTAHIYAQRVTAEGTPQWTADGVALCTADNSQLYPTLVTDGAGGAIVTWEDDRGGTFDIYAQRVNAAGVPQWTANGVKVCGAALDQLVPAIASDGAGGAIVSWEDKRSGTNYDIYAQRVNAAGVLQWTADGVLLCVASNDQIEPTIVSDGAGGAIVTWSDFRSGTNWDVYAQRMDAAGISQWIANGVALCNAANDQYHPSVVADGAGGAIATWQDWRNDIHSPDIYSQRVDSGGSPQWIADGVALCTDATGQYNPKSASDGAGGAIVTWRDSRSGDADIYAQHLSGAGVPQWAANGLGVCTAANDQSDGTIVSDGSGSAIIAWNDYRNGTNGDIYAQRVNALGVLGWTADGVAICTAANSQGVASTIAPDGAGGAIVTWSDSRSGSDPASYRFYDIYAQNVRADGALGGPLVSVPPLSIAASFAIRSIQPNPSFGDLRISFSLFDATPATLELFDVNGRRRESQLVGDLGPGAHVVSLPTGAHALPAGLYYVSLTQGSHRAFSKVAIFR